LIQLCKPRASNRAGSDLLRWSLAGWSLTRMWM
jgi:hypothetical protein